ncbi:pyrroloquinoline quinone-dependent dehydrogenase [Gammaproteobacteria bacterium]|jgi:quinoprotein glucose dehydrogenase|nr:pyrroloquinoline quinone-dependent dehydrogenase [Gammaproteobacteria bacterium]MCH9854319.1 pyrroloquinoline quinone-dependent dehydrogenase [Gammaproteobacteria bacterium]MDA7782762.1 pyrroloquinoline quinone-dependent dehydrogenase [Gammaproteobacteria bacterium]MDA8602269.1 pyrroloquinoline quinone-dependent dehydrogenase [Gammaproteobacteria bacterium]MDA9296618.1 pyrroloquinoline quinone-dependent dehydrogenase [Gammaproteobacteria bacterium]
MKFPLLLAPLVVCLGASVAGSAFSADWPSYGGDNGSQKYSTLDQVNASNVADLVPAWSWESPDNATVADNIAQQNYRAVPAGFKATPIVIEGVMYVPSSFGRVVALDAASGEEKWIFDTEAWSSGRPANLGYNSRGVGYWSSEDKQRIFFATNDANLWSIDAVTGLPDSSFGDGGKIDLSLGLGREIDKRQYGVVSPPLVTNDIVVVNSIINDGPTTKEMPPGNVRGFDPRTGDIVWMFETIPQAGAFGNETWENGSWEYTGNTNSWTIMSADDELGIVYLPIGTPTNDWYGGLRHGDNLFAESLVAVEAKTGKRLWHFQMVHHGVWDYDLPAAPTLVDLTVEGKKIKAVAQISKQGFTYVFDRVTGDPVWPIIETPVPQSNVPGEKLSLTQPIPTKPPAFELQGLSDDTLVNFTPELRREAEQLIEQFDSGPLFTPPSLRGTINIPGWGGGGWWTGAAFDPDSGLFYIPSATIPIVVQLQEADPEKSNLRYVRGGAMNVGGPQGLPLTKPPYGRIVATNLNSGEQEWMIPHGEGIRQKIIDMGILDPGPVGGPSRTGPLLTKTLLFVAQVDNGRNLLRAFDKATGAVLHEIELPLPPQGSPMTYAVKGQQYLSIAIGGGPDSRLFTLSLPE